MKQKVNKIEAALDNVANFFDDAAIFCDIVIATPIRNIIACDDALNPFTLSDGYEHSPLFHENFGPEHIDKDLSVIVLTALISLLNAGYYYKKKKRATTIASTKYLMHVLQQKEYSPVIEQQPFSQKNNINLKIDQMKLKPAKGNKLARISRQDAYFTFIWQYGLLNTFLNEIEDPKSSLIDHLPLGLNSPSCSPELLLKDMQAFQRRLALYYALYHSNPWKRHQFYKYFIKKDPDLLTDYRLGKQGKQRGINHCIGLQNHLTDEFNEIKNKLTHQLEKPGVGNIINQANTRLAHCYEQAIGDKANGVDLQFTFNEQGKGSLELTAKVNAREQNPTHPFDSAWIDQPKTSLWMRGFKEIMALLGSLSFYYWIFWVAAWMTIGIVNPCVWVLTPVFFIALLPLCRWGYKWGYKSGIQRYKQIIKTNQNNPVSPPSEQQSRTLSNQERELFLKAFFTEFYFNHYKQNLKNQLILLQKDRDLISPKPNAPRNGTIPTEQVCPVIHSNGVNHKQATELEEEPTTASKQNDTARLPSMICSLLNKGNQRTRKIIGACSAWGSGCIKASMISWFLGAILIVCGAISPIGIAMPIYMAAFGLIFGLYCATQQFFNIQKQQKYEEDEINQKQRLLQEINQLEESLQLQKTSIQNNKEKLYSLLEKLSTEQQIEYRDRYPEFFSPTLSSVNRYGFLEYLEPNHSQVGTTIKKGFCRLKALIAGAGSGAFIVRLILGVGVLSVFSITGPYFIASIVLVAALWGIFKMYEYHHHSKMTRQNIDLQRAPLIKRGLEKEQQVQSKIQHAQTTLAKILQHKLDQKEKVSSIPNTVRFENNGSHYLNGIAQGHPTMNPYSPDTKHDRPIKKEGRYLNSPSLAQSCKT